MTVDSRAILRHRNLRSGVLLYLIVSYCLNKSTHAKNTAECCATGYTRKQFCACQCRGSTDYMLRVYPLLVIAVLLTVICSTNAQSTLKPGSVITKRLVNLTADQYSKRKWYEGINFFSEKILMTLYQMSGDSGNWELNQATLGPSATCKMILRLLNNRWSKLSKLDLKLSKDRLSLVGPITLHVYRWAIFSPGVSRELSVTQFAKNFLEWLRFNWHFIRQYWDKGWFVVCCN